MKMGIKPSARPQTIMQAYRIANRQAAATDNFDAKIQAFDKVINFCSHTDSCRLEPSVKRNVLLYWAYDKVGQAYMQKHQRDEAVEYFQRGLSFARNVQQRKAMLAKLALLHRQSGHLNEWLEMRRQLIGLLPEAERFAAYAHLAGEHRDDQAAAAVWEQALDNAGAGKLSVVEKCAQIMTACQQLLAIYQMAGKTTEWQRIKNLANKTEVLEAKAKLPKT